MLTMTPEAFPTIGRLTMTPEAYAAVEAALRKPTWLGCTGCPARSLVEGESVSAYIVVTDPNHRTLWYASYPCAEHVYDLKGAAVAVRLL